jgi:hypothetical protein
VSHGVAPELHAALVRLALDRALLCKQPAAALPALNHAELILRVQRDAQLRAESFRTNRPFSRYGASGPVTWLRPLRPSFRPRRAPVRIGRPNVAGRASRPRQVRRAVRSGASRDGPGLGDDDPPDSDKPDHVARPQLPRAELDYLRAEDDRRRRERLAAQRALDRALFAWGDAEVVR